MQLSFPSSVLTFLITSLLLTPSNTAAATTTINESISAATSISTTLPPSTITSTPVTTTTSSSTNSDIPSSSSIPFYYSPITYFTASYSGATPYSVTQTYLISGTFTSSIPTSGVSLDKTIPIIASPGTVTQSFGPGTGEDGLVDDYAAFGSAQSRSNAAAYSSLISIASEMQRTRMKGSPTRSPSASLNNDDGDVVAKAKATWRGEAAAAGKDGRGRKVVLTVMVVVLVGRRM